MPERRPDRKRKKKAPEHVAAFRGKPRSRRDRERQTWAKMPDRNDSARPWSASA